MASARPGLGSVGGGGSARKAQIEEEGTFS
jgi:hypothetical protein